MGACGTSDEFANVGALSKQPLYSIVVVDSGPPIPALQRRDNSPSRSREATGHGRAGAAMVIWAVDASVIRVIPDSR